MKRMQPHQKMIIATVVSIVTLGLFSFTPVATFALDDRRAPGKLMVGTMLAPPFYMKTADGRWKGLSIELWQAVAQDMGVAFEFREYSSFGPLLDAIEKGELDVVPALPAKARYENFLDLSPSYLRSGLAIAVPTQSSALSWLHVVRRLASRDFLNALGFLLLLALIAGTILWLFEGRRNRDMFGGGTAQGIGHSVWWAVVTMTTVGYGDKAPQTIAGRIVACIWMLASIVFISSFTATVTTSMTISELRGKVRGFTDLPSVRVGSLDQSEAQNFLTRHGIAVRPFVNIQEGLLAIVTNKIDAFVLNEAVLKYLVSSEFPGRVHVIPGTFDQYYVSIAVTQNTPLRESISRSLLKVINTDEWHSVLKRYIGHEL